MKCSCKLCTTEGCNCEEYANMLRALNNSNRLHVLNSLRAEERNVGEICRVTSLEQSCVSHCLRQLSQQGLVKSVTKGKYRLYSLATPYVENLMETIDKIIKTRTPKLQVAVK